MGDSLWSVVVIVGPIALVAALLFAILKNRRRKPHEEARTEQATHDLYKCQSAEDRARTP